MKTIRLFLIFAFATNMFLSARAQLHYQLVEKTEPYTELSGATSLTSNVWSFCTGSSYILFPSSVYNSFSFNLFDYIYYQSIYMYDGGTLAFQGDLKDTYRYYVKGFGFQSRTEDKGTSSPLSPVTYEITGTTPNKIMKVQWKNFGLCDDATGNDYLNLQIWFFQNTGAIEFHYGPSSVSSNYTKYPSLIWVNTSSSSVLEEDHIIGKPGNCALSYLTSAFDSMPPSGTVYRLEPNTQTLDTLPIYSSWAKKNTSTYFTGTAYDVATDANGYIYTSGTYSGSGVSFGSSTLTNYGIYDGYVAKYDSSGNVLWAKGFGGTYSDYNYAVAVDNSGNVYATGLFKGTLNYGSGTLTSNGDNDIFVIKYNSSGTVQWAKNAGGTGSDQGRDIAVDNSGNVYVTGCFSSGSFIFGSDTLTNSGLSAIHLLKYDSGGNPGWGMSIGGSIDDCGKGMVTDASGNIYLTGYFRATSLQLGTSTLTNHGSSDILLAKISSTGSVIWAKNIGGTGADAAYGIAKDNSGNLYFTGTFTGPNVYFHNINAKLHGTDMFVAKYTSSGNAVWVQSAGGAPNYPNGIAVNNQNNQVMVTGYFSGPYFKVGNKYIASNGDADIFLSAWDLDGNFVRTSSTGGTDTDYGYGVATDNEGRIYIAGDYESSTLNFGVNSLTGNGGKNMFLVKVNYSATGVAETTVQDIPVSIYPNPSNGEVTVRCPNLRKTEVFDPLGRLIKTQDCNGSSVLIDLKNEPKGLYLIKVSNDNGSKVMKVTLE